MKGIFNSIGPIVFSFSTDSVFVKFELFIQNTTNSLPKEILQTNTLKFSHLNKFSIIWHWAFESILQVDHVHWPAVSPTRNSYNSIRVWIGSDFHMYKFSFISIPFSFLISHFDSWIWPFKPSLPFANVRLLCNIFISVRIFDSFHSILSLFFFSFSFFTFRIKTIEWCYPALSMTPKEKKNIWYTFMHVSL